MVKILFAAPDRDLLMTYERLLSLEGHDVTAVFDGAQTVRKLSGQRYDLVVLDHTVPGIDTRNIMKLIRSEHMPVIQLLSRKITPSVLMEAYAADSYLSFPFLPDEFMRRIMSIAERAGADKNFTVDGVTVNESKFSSNDGTHFTNEEIDILHAAMSGGELPITSVSAYINALNNKFVKLGKKTRIKYVMNEGYRLVKDNE